MKEPHIEGLATHDGPESCAAAREGAGEVFDRGTRGRGIEPRNQSFRTPTLLSEAEGNTGHIAIARCGPVLRGRRPTARAEPLCARTGRSLGCPSLMVRRAASGRPEAASR